MKLAWHHWRIFYQNLNFESSIVLQDLFYHDLDKEPMSSVKEMLESTIYGIKIINLIDKSKIQNQEIIDLIKLITL